MNNTITVKDIETTLKNALSDASVQSADSTYEKTDDGYRLVIDIKNLFMERTNVIYTKFIFYVDKNKIYLLPSDNGIFQFRYLYDINCNYNVVQFDDIGELERIIKKIISKNKFGDNIKILSRFIKSPGTLINKWFSDNGVRNISVYEVRVDDRYKIIPCKSLSFNFVINLNNQMEIKLSLSKENKSDYVFVFRIYDDTIKEERSNLSTLVQTIGDTIKTKYV